MVGLVLCIIALVFAIIGMCKKGKKRGTAIAGLACAAVGFIVFLFASIIGMVSDDTDKQSDETTSEIVTEETTTEEITTEEITTDRAEVEQPEKSDNEFTYKDLNVVYKDSKVEKDKSGDDCLVVYFDYTNNSDENEAFVYTFNVKAFQNGVELESSWFHVNDETKNDEKEIQPGTTITVATAFVLTDSRDLTTIQVEPLISLSEEILFEKEIALK